jgi:hypothetical protein
MRSFLLLVVLASPSAVLADEPKKPEPLPAEVVKAWEDAGAEVGWMMMDPKSGIVLFAERVAERDVVQAVPAFAFRNWKAGMVAKLPAPEKPFGLELSTDDVTDASIKELAVLKQLTSLELGSTKVTDAGLKELAALKQLTSLYLYSTQVTDAGLKELATLKQLTSLALNSTQVTDAGLKELAALKNLTALDLTKTDVTDAGLKELTALKQLTLLNLWNTKVTDAGVKELQKALPKCEIRR